MRKLQSFIKSRRLFIFLMLLPALAFVLTFTYFPMCKGVVMAFQDYNLFNINKIK